MKSEIIKMVKRLAGHEFLYLDTKLQVKKTPHTIPVNVWAICVSPDDRIYLMDSNEESFELEEGDTDYSLVLNTVYQRIRMIYMQYQAA